MPRSTPSMIPCSIDLDADGKHFGHMKVPHSRTESAWGTLMVPIVSIRNGQGPRALLTGGNHGDEYEGQIALRKLAQAIAPDQIQGQVIIIPALNLPAVKAATRISPIDNGNMNRAFPGDPRGTITQRIAHYVTVELLPRVEAVLDMHSGGQSLDFIPSAIMHDLPDPQMFERTYAALQAFAAPVGLILTELDDVGMLDTEVEQSGKLFLSTELAGGATMTPETVRIGERGAANFLKYLGILRGEPEPGESPTRLMDTPDGAFVAAPAPGLCEPLAALGEEVAAGQPVAQIHNIENPELPPTVLTAPISGIVFCRRARGLAETGDCVAVMAVDRA